MASKPKSKTQPDAPSTGTPELEDHPFANLLPMMSDQEYDELKRSILSAGLQEPVTTYRGKIIDGRNRYRACKELGVPVEPKDAGLQDDQAAIDYVITRNLQRRNLSPSQKAVVALRAVDQISESVQKSRIQKIRQAVADEALKKTRGIRASLPSSGPKGGTSADSEEAKTINIVGEMFGVSGTYVRYAKALQEKDPKLLDQVASGGKSLYLAYEAEFDPHLGKRGKPRLSVASELDALVALVKRRGGMERLLAKLAEAKAVLKEIQAEEAPEGKPPSRKGKKAAAGTGPEPAKA